MKWLLSLLVVITAGFAAAQDAIAPASRTELFDGKSLTGWNFFMAGGADPAKTWSVANGVIHCSGKPAGYLRSGKRYHDYILTVEWRFVKIAPKEDNSGILVHMQEPDKVWPKCVQIQGKSGHQGDLFLMAGAESDEHRGKDANTPLPLRGDSREKPVGEWNVIRVVCAGDSVKVSVNGEAVNDTRGCTLAAGFIGIQSEGGDMEIRRITVEPVK